MTLQEQQQESVNSGTTIGSSVGGIIQLPQLRLDIEDLLREYVALMQTSSSPATLTEQFSHQSNSPSHHSNLSNDIDNVYYCSTIVSPNNSEKQTQEIINQQQPLQPLKRNNSSSTLDDDKTNYSKSKIGKTRRKKNKLPGESEFKLWTWIGEKKL